MNVIQGFKAVIKVRVLVWKVELYLQYIILILSGLLHDLHVDYVWKC